MRANLVLRLMILMIFFVVKCHPVLLLQLALLPCVGGLLLWREVVDEL